jgi:hypothetical protein
MTADSMLIQVVRLITALDNGAKWSGAPERLGLLLSRRAASAGAGVASNGMGYSKVGLIGRHVTSQSSGATSQDAT